MTRPQIPGSAAADSDGGVAQTGLGRRRVDYNGRLRTGAPVAVSPAWNHVKN